MASPMVALFRNSASMLVLCTLMVKRWRSIPGGHHISEEAAEKIMTEIAPMLIERFKTLEGPGHIVSNGLNEDEKMRIKFFES